MSWIRVSNFMLRFGFRPDILSELNPGMGRQSFNILEIRHMVHYVKIGPKQENKKTII